MNLSKEALTQIDANISKCVEWFKANALTDESISADYNPNPDQFSRRRFNDTIRVSKNGELVESGNLWGYNTTWKELPNLQTWEKLEILEQWSAIKDRFSRNKMEIIEKNQKTSSAIFDFEV